MIFQLLCGWFIDVIGLKFGFMICVIFWVLVCIVYVGVGSWLYLVMLCFFMGGVEVVVILVNVKIIGEWFLKFEWLIVVGWVGVGFFIGVMLVLLIIYFVYVFFGW